MFGSALPSAPGEREALEGWNSIAERMATRTQL
jgi:hypothetical protein